MAGLTPGDQSAGTCRMLTDTNISVGSVVDTIIGRANITEVPCCRGLDICLNKGGCL